MRTLYKHGGSYPRKPVKRYRHGGAMHDAEGNPVEETIAGGGINPGDTEVEEGVGTKVMNFMQDKYNQFTGKGPQPIPVEKFESTNENYSGMDEVVDWMLEQKSQGMGPGFQTTSLEKLRSGGQSKDPNAPNYMPAPSPDDIERKAMMFSNVFDAVRSNPYMGLEDRFGGDYTDEKRAEITKVFNEQGVPEEWQNEFFESLRLMRPGITQGGYSGKSGMEIEGLEAGPIETPRPNESLQITQTPISMPETRRRGIFRRR